jgi:hypothetical protein
LLIGPCRHGGCIIIMGSLMEQDQAGCHRTTFRVVAARDTVRVSSKGGSAGKAQASPPPPPPNSSTFPPSIHHTVALDVNTTSPPIPLVLTSFYYKIELQTTYVELLCSTSTGTCEQASACALSHTLRP